MNNTIYDCLLMPLNKVYNRAGNITIVENHNNIPFAIKRVFYLYDIPCGKARGGHAHKSLQEIIIAASGAFDVLIDDGLNKRNITLNRPDYGLHIVPGIWFDLHNFSSGAISLVMASELYKEDDYIKDYNHFVTIKDIHHA